MSDKPIILIGAGGHASVLADILKQNQQIIAGVITLITPSSTIFADIKQYDSDDDLALFNEQDYDVLVALGPKPYDEKRINVISMLHEQGYTLKSVVSKHAIISDYAVISPGAQILPGAIINAEAYIGLHVVINSRAVIEHDCTIGDFCHIAPGATLCGGVNIARNTFIGAGAVILPGISIGSDTVIGANALVDKDVPDNTTFYGCRGKVR